MQYGGSMHGIFWYILVTCFTIAWRKFQCLATFVLWILFEWQINYDSMLTILPLQHSKVTFISGYCFKFHHSNYGVNCSKNYFTWEVESCWHWRCADVFFLLQSCYKSWATFCQKGIDCFVNRHPFQVLLSVSLVSSSFSYRYLLHKVEKWVHKTFYTTPRRDAVDICIHQYLFFSVTTCFLCAYVVAVLMLFCIEVNK